MFICSNGTLLTYICNTIYFLVLGSLSNLDFGRTGNQGTHPVVATIYFKTKQKLRSKRNPNKIDKIGVLIQ